MRWRPLLWLMLSLVCFAGAYYFWNLGETWAARKRQEAGPRQATNQIPPATNPAARPPQAQVPPVTPVFGLLSSPATVAEPWPPAKPLFPYRLSNTRKSVDQLLRDPKAILLENALVDTARGLALEIPAALKAQGDPGAYIVQAKGQLDDAFRSLLKQSGAEIISYIPNNAYLVRASAQVARQLGQAAQTQAVLAYEPYFKLKSALLELAVKQEPLPQRSTLRVLVFDEAHERAVADLKGLGAEVLAEERSPFGAILRVRPPLESLAQVASLEGVQAVELARARVSANDLTRVSLGVAPGSLAPDNYLGLTGDKVMVNVNDSGVATNQLDLLGRVVPDLPAAGVDTNGHGTHVAGIIASSGGQSMTVSNASGSVMPPVDGQFRGMAPKAKIYAIEVDLHTGAPISGETNLVIQNSDQYLQEKAAHTNVFISNNSWAYQGSREYDLGAASYDAAVRDASPQKPGAQPLLYVFAAGNLGNGDDDGTGGAPGTVQSPGTAKNVITVGASEQVRNITNEVWKCTASTVDGTNGVSCETNQPWSLRTDNSAQVAYYSSRGNVGIMLEGGSGRFKPDVVAPGSFVVSTRSPQWDQAAYFNSTSHVSGIFVDQSVNPGELWVNSIFIPDNAVQATITAVSRSLVDLPIFVRQGEIPALEPGGYDFVRTNRVSMPPDGGPTLSPRGVDWYYGVGNVSTSVVNFTVRTDLAVTNDTGNYNEVLNSINDQLGPYYRYESGSSMSAAAVSGTLALMQEFFEQRLKQTNSPALMKALLINGSRSLGNLYDLQVSTPINYQGWGMPNLTNSLPASLSASGGGGRSMHYYDQSPAESLASGQSRTRFVRLSGGAQSVPLRSTLVWTDPPGNPIASVKLVNDLDLIVTNLDSGDVFYGNDLGSGNDYNLPWDTNVIANLDVINNVENVFLSPRLGTNYSVTVLARRVNVSAVPGNTNNIAQDYALVISSGNGEFADGLTITDQAPIDYRRIPVTAVGNNLGGSPEDIGGILLNERAGAHSPFLGLNTVALSNTVATMGGAMSGLVRVGVTNQWHFYMITNAASYTNAAFLTFLPPNLAVPREGVYVSDPDNATRTEADVDLYVSREPGLTNLDSGAISRALKSVAVGGTETIVSSNAQPGLYYIGVKSEDMESAEYGFLGVFSQMPFALEDENGNLTLRGFPSLAPIPDGSPLKPGGAYVFAVAPKAIQVRRVIVTNNISHQLMGDLLGTLSHSRAMAVLNNHSPNTAVTNVSYIYDDSSQNDVPGSRPTDGPGSLKDFAGKDGVGQWMLTQIDNKPNHIGTNNWLRVFLEKQQDLQNGVTATILPGACRSDYVNVPLEATNLTVTVAVVSGTGPVAMQICPAGEALTDQCHNTVITNTGVTIVIDLSSDPPLNPGLYSIRLCNLGRGPLTVNIKATVKVDLEGLNPVRYDIPHPMPILDDAVTYSSIFITNNQKIAAAEVGLRVSHPRVSDIAFTLVSPIGTRVLLAENRGGLTTNGMGFDIITTNVGKFSADGGPAAQTNVFDTGQTFGTIRIDYDFLEVPDAMKVYYENRLIFSSGPVTNIGTWNIDYGPGTSTDVTIVMNEGDNPNPDTAWFYTVTSTRTEYVYLTLTDNTNYTSTPIKFAPTPYTNFNYIGSSALLTNRMFYFPEEPLAKLIGERALGEWKLEMWDARVGATNPPPKLLGWELAFFYENTIPRPQPVVPDQPLTNNIGPGRMAYYVVDAPVWATFATNTLISATAPVNLLFNQTRLPSGTNGPGDFTLLAGSTGGFALLSSAGGTPPLVPGQRYYLGVQNTNTNAVTFSLAVSFDVTPLRDNVPVSGTIAATPMPRYFSFDVLPSAASVSFQLFNLSGDANLVASKSPTFPTLTAYDYGSFNPNTDNEDITITPFSNPLPLSPGRWLLGVFNNDVTNVNYTIVAKQTVEPATNIVITGIQVTSTNLCLTWTSVSGDSYYVEGAVTVRDAVWTPVSPTIVATDSVTTYCVPLPSAYSFFRVRPGAAPNVPGGTVAIGKVTYTPAGVTIEWTAPVTSQFNVQWTQEVNPPVWTSFPETITSTTGTFFYLDDGSKTGGMGTVRFYRLLEL